MSSSVVSLLACAFIRAISVYTGRNQYLTNAKGKQFKRLIKDNLLPAILRLHFNLILTRNIDDSISISCYYIAASALAHFEANPVF